MKRAVLLFVLAYSVVACSPNSASNTAGRGLTVLSLNLHTYQELRTTGANEAELTDQLARQRIESYGSVFDRIAAGINQLDPDIICFQEVGEWPGSVRTDPDPVVFGATDTNMVHQILSRLGARKYHYTMDWSHYGWDVWLEGSAILSKYPIEYTESRFISNPDNGRYDFWKSRNVPMAVIDAPDFGHIAIFSVHTGWWDDPEEPFQDQFRRLQSWTADIDKRADATILCGDFNVAADSPAYRFITNSGYLDAYVLANPDGMLDATIGDGADGWGESDGGQRIDYILINDDSPLDIRLARRVFTEKDFGRVSDHVGIYAEFMKP